MIMLRTFSKPLFFALLLMLSASQVVCAEVKQYQYDGKLPFVQMMLNMMVAMGMLDRVPVSGLYGSYPYPGSSLSNYNNPYMRALALRGLSNGLYPGASTSYLKNPYLFNSATQNLYGGYPNTGYGTNPFLSTPWLQSPWSQPALNSVSPLWGSPSWGVLPTESYPLNNYWSGTDLTGWVNEPWETSSWNPEAESRQSETTKAESQAQSAPINSPLVQIYNTSNDTQHRVDSQQQVRQPAQNNRYNSSPLAKLAPPDYRDGPPRSEPYSRQPGPAAGRPPQEPPRSQTKVYQKPCITDFCGLKKPDLDGFWVAQNGEMLGIKNQQFLWSDGASRYLSGRIKIENEYLLASVEGHEQIMTFKYKLAGNHLLTLQPDGVIREFTRMTATQYYNQFPYDQYEGYGQNYDLNYGPSYSPNYGQGYTDDYYP
jgi:hypothetical protein